MDFSSSGEIYWVSFEPALLEIFSSISVPPRSLIPHSIEAPATNLPSLGQLAWIFVMYGYRATLDRALIFRCSRISGVLDTWPSRFFPGRNGSSTNSVNPLV